MKIYDITGIGANLTGSFSGSFKEIFTGTATTASYVQYSNVANKPTLVSGSSQITYSGISSKPEGIVSGSSQVAAFGYAITGSNQFKASQAITGSLTVTGAIVAQTLNVQQVTSSIVFSSGSNRFGNNSSNTHRFTGSVNITGSITSNGALNGTSGTFTGDLIAASATINTPSNAIGILLNGRSADNVSQIRFGANSGGGAYNTIQASPTDLQINSQGNTPILFGTNLGGGGGTRMTISGAGAVTLTGALNGTSASFTGTIANPLHVETSGLDGGIQIYRNVNSDGGSAALFMSHKSTAGVINTANIEVVGSGSMLFRTGATGLGNFGTTRLSISSTGAATFSSSVTGNANSNTFGNASLSGRALIIQAGSTNQAIMFKNAAGGDATLFINGTSTTVDYNFNTYSVGDALVIKNNGNVGIGTASPVGKLDVYRAAGGSGTSAIVISNGEGGGRNWALSTEVVTAGDFAILCSSTTGGTPSPSSANSKLYITSGGNVGIGTTSPTEKLHIFGGGGGPEFRMEGSGHSWYIRPYNDNYNVLTPSGRQAVSYLNNGDVRNYNNTTTWQQVSDVRVKENINTIPDAISKILSLNPVIFDYKKEFADKNNWDDNKKINNAGFIAQEFEIIFPKYISTNEFLIGETVVDDFKSIDTGHLVAYLVKAIQELKSENDTLKSILQRNNIS